ncbi:MAG: universal stress protein [Dehalococcoidales bacterium]|nr:universal stress protein [Dehalococcoidales bacterium]
MLEKILVCLDGSDAAERILSYIVKNALKLQSKVILLRVVDLPETTMAINIPGSPAIPIETRGAVERTLNEEKEAIDYLKRLKASLKRKKLDVESIVLSGRTGETIINYAQENDCTLIAIATHGRGGLRRLALGSTADFVVRNSSIPVLTIRR